MNCHRVSGVIKATLGLAPCSTLPYILRRRKTWNSTSHGWNTNIFKCSNTQIAQWLYLRKGLSLRLNLVLRPGGCRQSACLPCLRQRKPLSLCLAKGTPLHAVSPETRIGWNEICSARPTILEEPLRVHIFDEPTVGHAPRCKMSIRVLLLVSKQLKSFA